MIEANASIFTGKEAGKEFRLSFPTLEEYVVLTPRLVTPVWSATLHKQRRIAWVADFWTSRYMQQMPVWSYPCLIFTSHRLLKASETKATNSRYWRPVPVMALWPFIWREQYKLRIRIHPLYRQHHKSAYSKNAQFDPIQKSKRINRQKKQSVLRMLLLCRKTGTNGVPSAELWLTQLTSRPNSRRMQNKLSVVFAVVYTPAM